MKVCKEHVAYIEDSRELLEKMETSLLELERSNCDPDLIRAIYRAANIVLAAQLYLTAVKLN